MEQVNKINIVLASKSIRRKELLKEIVDDFIVFPSEVNEEEIKEKDPIKLVLTSAIMKAKNVGEKFPDKIIISADTIVVYKDKILGKPKSFYEGKEMLKTLSGTKHKVITGVAIYKKDIEKLLSDYEITYVKFKNLKEEEIEDYLKNDDFTDKAGSYAVQKVKDKFVEEIEGDYENVVGFPVKKVKRMLEEFKNLNEEKEELEIVDIALPNNWGVAKKGNFVLFIPDVVIGDRVKIEVLKESKNFSSGEVIKIEKPSPFRIEPKCPHFGKCGGCIFQNLIYEKQIELKENYLFQTLKKIGEIDIEKIKKWHIIPSPEIYFYRNKMEYAFGNKNEKVILGLRERVSPFKKYRKQVVEIEKCFIFSPVVEKIFPLFLEFANKNGFVAYDPFTKKGFLRHLVLKESKSTKELMVILVTRSGEIKDFTELTEKLIEKIPQIKSFYWVINNQISDVVNFEKKNLIYGKPYIEEKIGCFKFKIHPQVFFQPNTKMAEILYNKIVEIAQIKGDEKVLGLYCGIGPIEIFLSKYTKEVIGIDSNPINIAIGVENCKINNIKNCSFYEGEVEKLLNRISFGNIDIIVVDPPRNGISKKALKYILKLNPKKFIYVSCNPSAFARDLKIFQENNYRIKEIFSFDFFPHTGHFETLGLCEKG